MTVLVLGARGFLGSNLVKLLRPRFDVISVSRSAERDTVSADFAEWPRVVDQLHARAPVAVINTVAIADRAVCDRDPSACDRVNHVIARDVGVVCAARNVPLIHISTDGLFGQGTVASAPAYFGAGDRIVELNAYASSKHAAEMALERLGWGHVLRLSFVGPDNGTGRGLLRFMADRVRSGGTTIDGYVDNWFTPVHVRDVADLIAELVDGRTGGFTLRHMASHPALTKYDYLKVVLEAAGIPMDVVPIERQGTSHAILVDQSLASDRPVPLASVIDRSVHDLKDLLAG